MAFDPGTRGRRQSRRRSRWFEDGAFPARARTGDLITNKARGYYFASGAARLGKSLAMSNSSGSVAASSSVVSAGNNWASGISTPSFVSTDASTAYNARQSDGSLPTTTFLTTGSTTIGSTMN